MTDFLNYSTTKQQCNLQKTPGSGLHPTDEDIHPCPANVTKREVKHPCVMYEKAVKQIVKTVSGDDSRKWIHIRCADIFEGVYNDKVK